MFSAGARIARSPHEKIVNPGDQPNYDNGHGASGYAYAQPPNVNQNENGGHQPSPLWTFKLPRFLKRRRNRDRQQTKKQPKPCGVFMRCKAK